MMWHHLALAFGMPVPQLQAQMSSQEFSMWLAYSRMCPIGPHHEERRWAKMYSLIMNVLGGKSVQPTEVSPYLKEYLQGTPEQQNEREQAMMSRIPGVKMSE